MHVVRTARDAGRRCAFTGAALGSDAEVSFATPCPLRRERLDAGLAEQERERVGALAALLLGRAEAVARLVVDAEQHRLADVDAACNRAAIFAASQASTRGSLMPVVSSTAGYSRRPSPSGTGSSRTAPEPFLDLTVPNSGMLGTPFDEDSARIMSDTGTCPTAAPNRSGRSVIARPTKMPPALPPMIESLSVDVHLFATSHSAHAIASRQVFGLVAL